VGQREKKSPKSEKKVSSNRQSDIFALFSFDSNSFFLFSDLAKTHRGDHAVSSR
jgi:hypothetical protein